MIFFLTCPGTTAKTGALGGGLIRVILSYPILFAIPAQVPLQKVSRQGVYIYEPILNVPDKNYGSLVNAHIR